MKRTTRKMLAERAGMTYPRVKMGLGQSEFAQYLGIKTSSLVMWENNHRSLPKAALMKLADLEIKIEAGKNALQQQRSISHPAEKQHLFPGNKFCSSLLAKESRLLQQAFILKRRLSNMKLQYEHARVWLQTIADELQNKNLQETDWWEVQQMLAIDKLEKYGLAAQAILQTKISLLESQAALFKKAQRDFVELTPYLELDKADLVDLEIDDLEI